MTMLKRRHDFTVSRNSAKMMNLHIKGPASRLMLAKSVDYYQSKDRFVRPAPS